MRHADLKNETVITYYIYNLFILIIPLENTHFFAK